MLIKCILTLILTTAAADGDIAALLGTPFQHEQLESGLHSSHARRFPVLDELLLHSPEALHKEYWPSDNITTWSDDSCPVFLVTGDVVVCGNLFVRGKLTVLTAVNTSVFEDVVSQEDGSEIKTQKLSRFVTTRCTKPVPHRLVGAAPPCTTRGNLVVPRSGLLISGTLTVLGSAVTGSMTVDGAASVAMGVATFLNLHASPSPNRQYPIGRAARRSTRRLERPAQATATYLPIPHSVWPSAAEQVDSVCHNHGDKIPDSLFLPKGMLFLRNHASLFTFGKTVAKLAGLDRTAMWLSRCGDVTAAGTEGSPGDIILLSSSTLLVTGERTKVTVGDLIASEGSLVSIQGALMASDLVKVTLGSSLTVSHDAEVFDVALSDSSTLSVSRSLRVNDLAMLSGGRLMVGQNMDALSLEAYDQGEIFIKRDLNVGEYVVADEGARIDIRDGSCNIGGACLLANHSSLILAHPKATLTVAEDLKGRSGVVIQAPSATIGCSLFLDLFSTVKITESLRVREVEILKRAINDTKMDPPACDVKAPIMLIQKSDLTVDQSVKIGHRLMPSDDQTGPTLSIFGNSQIKFGSYLAPSKKHATILKGGTKMNVIRLEAAATSLEALFQPGQLLTLEAGSLLKGIGLDAVELKSMEISETSQAFLAAATVQADWISLKSRSKLDLMNFTPLFLRRGIEVSEDSTCALNGGLSVGTQFDHLLSSTGSEVTIAGRCGQHGVEAVDGVIQIRGKLIAQDAGSITLEGTVKAHSATEITAESNSQIDFSCYLDNELEAAAITFKKTAESNINIPSSALPVRPVVYRLKVPPSDSSTLKAFTNGTIHRAGYEHARRNGFWEAFQRSTAALMQDEGAPVRRNAATVFSDQQQPAVVEAPAPVIPPRPPKSRRRRDL